MNLIDLLVELQIPIWLVLLLAIAGILAMTYYKHRLDRRVKELEYQLDKEATNHEKDLEFVQDRHKKRLEALDEVNVALMEFDHAFDHLRRGNSHYASRLEEYFHISRTLARKYESLLGEDFYQTIINLTDAEITILQASFILNNEGFQKLKNLDLPASALNSLKLFIEQPVSVINAQQLVQSIDDRVLWRHKREIFYSCKLSQEYNGAERDKAEIHLRDLKQMLLRTLPRPDTQV